MPVSSFAKEPFQVDEFPLHQISLNIWHEKSSQIFRRVGHQLGVEIVELFPWNLASM